jgi:uncharacterized OsmC-like protein
MDFRKKFIGVKPCEMLLVAFASCTAIDKISEQPILKNGEILEFGSSLVFGARNSEEFEKNLKKGRRFRMY